MEGLIIIGQVVLPFVIGAITISITSALVVGYLSEEAHNDKKRI